MKRGTRSRLAGLLIVLSASVPALAGTHTWKGAAGGVWSASGNWTGGVPTSGEAGGTLLVFGTNTSSTDDINGLVVDTIEFQGGGNVVAGTHSLGVGNTSPFAAFLVNDTGSNTLASSLPLTLGNNLNSSVVAGSLTIAGNMSGSAGLNFAAGTAAGSLLLFGTNTYAGSTYVGQGILYLNSPNFDGAISSDVILGNGGSSRATSRAACPSGTGVTLTVNDTGGATVAHQWRKKVSGTPSDIPGETGTTYLVKAPDFPGAGMYQVYCVSTPSCGAGFIASNAVNVLVGGGDTTAPTVTSPADAAVTQTVCQ